MTRSLMTRDTDFCQHGMESSSHDMINASYVARTMWKGSGVAVQLNVNSFFLRCQVKTRKYVHCKPNYFHCIGAFISNLLHCCSKLEISSPVYIYRVEEFKFIISTF